ncbi:MAG: hypothetical protein JNL04_02550 [Rhodospirillaceae bacterium]|nr:hypothetical protein [Rhodospirillaceae bacterium]
MRPVVDDTTRRSISLRIIPIILIATAAAFFFFPAEQRPVIFRVSLVASLVVMLSHLIARAIGAFRNDDPNSFEQALEPSPPAVRMDATLNQLRDEIRHSRNSRRYFDRVLWPRLRTLAAKAGEAQGDLPPPPPHWSKRRGPSLAEISRLVDHLEKKR